MHTIRYIKAYYFAAFLLGAIVALLVTAPVRATESSQPVPGETSGLASRPMLKAYH